MVIDSRHLTIHSQIVMQKRKRARKVGEFTSATNIAKKLPPRCGPSSNFELPNIDPAASVMTSSNAGPCDDCVQIVDDVIKTHLIDNTVGGVGAGSPSESIYTELAWTSACEVLLQTFQKAHPSVRPPSTDDSACSDARLAYQSTADSKVREAAYAAAGDIQNVCAYQPQR